MEQKSKINLKNIIAYIQGNLRYVLYNNKLKFLIRKSTREQIEYRINSMNKECYDSGSCITCGCRTTQLQMANKACDGGCYPKMLSKISWELIKLGFDIPGENKVKWTINKKLKQFVKYE